MSMAPTLEAHVIVVGGTALVWGHITGADSAAFALS
jgi:hypothetical protein